MRNRELGQTGFEVLRFCGLLGIICLGLLTLFVFLLLSLDVLMGFIGYFNDISYFLKK